MVGFLRTRPNVRRTRSTRRPPPLVQGRTPPAATWDKQMAESALTECLEEVDDPRLLTWRDFSILRIELQIKTPKGTSEDEERDLSNPAAAFESGEWAENQFPRGSNFRKLVQL
eukprot:GABV01006854.1.p2 GENE.GABV01006854.1~~GABV01006854.1.p2  ORF type:complete len:114 (+),score=31.19 GABV01006854.1:72-413(+)